MRRRGPARSPSGTSSATPPRGPSRGSATRTADGTTSWPTRPRAPQANRSPCSSIRSCSGRPGWSTRPRSRGWATTHPSATARFVDAFSAGRLVPPDRVEEAWTPAAVEGGRGPYGLGWFVEDTPVGRVVWHGGQWPGYSGLLLHVPGGGLTLTVLANAWGVSLPFYGIGTGTALYNAIAASFLHHVVLERGAGPGPVPDMPWDAAPEDLRRSGAGLDPSARYFWGAELFGRGLL
ncbi:MAG: serine hydrolase, partial [Gemmatimonadota bacterium]